MHQKYCLESHLDYASNIQINVNEIIVHFVFKITKRNLFIQVQGNEENDFIITSGY